MLFRILNDLLVKRWDHANLAKQVIVDDYLSNIDLTQEIVAGGHRSIDNLRTIYKGLSGQVKGYDYRLLVDSENDSIINTCVCGEQWRL
jgi:hypothetical protein